MKMYSVKSKCRTNSRRWSASQSSQGRERVLPANGLPFFSRVRLSERVARLPTHRYQKLRASVSLEHVAIAKGDWSGTLATQASARESVTSPGRLLGYYIRFTSLMCADNALQKLSLSHSLESQPFSHSSDSMDQRVETLF